MLNKTTADIRPPVRRPGYDRPLPDYSARLARRTGTSVTAVIARLDTDERPHALRIGCVVDANHSQDWE